MAPAAEHVSFAHSRQIWPEKRHTLQSGGEEADMGRLVAGNLLQGGIEGRVETSRGKLVLGEVGQTLTVELILEVFEGQSIVEDIG